MRTKIQRLRISTLILLGLTSPGFAGDQSITSRIVGGSETSISVVPATVALINNNALSQTGSFFQSQFCGGTVIDSRWVLTAAHCLVADDGSVSLGSSLSVLMGSTDLNDPVNQPVGVTQVIVHENYTPSRFSHDIALLRLESNAVVTATPIDQQAVQINDIAFIAGWGAVQSGADGQQQTFPSKLRGAFVRMVPGNECGQRFAAYQGAVDSSQLCAGISDGHVDSCQGDSGGPLYRVSETSSQPVSVAGITSFGIGCGNAATPGVYTGVTAFANWIQTRTGGVATGQPANTIPVNDDPQTTPVSQPGAAVTPPAAAATPLVPADTGTTALGSSSAGASGLMLPLLALLTLMRKFPSWRPVARLFPQSEKKYEENKDYSGYRAYKASGEQVPAIERHAIKMLVLLAGIVILTLGIRPMQADEKQGTAIALANQPFTEQRDDVLLKAQSLWQSEPVCTLVRTGYGMSRRAHFLETCTCTHAASNTVLGETPSKVEYLFLESKLVQIAYEFDEIRDEREFYRLARLQTEELQETTRFSIVIDDDYRIKVSDAQAIEHIHLLGNTL